MILNETYPLSNGVTIPKLGFGTWKINNEIAAQAVRDAISIGYRHIDTAQAYGNEVGVGEGILTSGVAREEIFVTTKLTAEIKNYEEARIAIETSLAKLNVGYIDLMIIHSPQPWEHFREGHYFEGNLEAWKALEEAYKAKKIRAIGVSNFEEIDLDNLFQHAEIKPMVNQILTHISNTPFALIEYCHQQDVLVQAYSPIAHGELQKNQNVIDMAMKYGVSVAQLSIRYCLQLGLLPLPKSTSIDHMRNNTIVDFEITHEDMEGLLQLDKINNYGEHSYFPVFSGK